MRVCQLFEIQGSSQYYPEGFTFELWMPGHGSLRNTLARFLAEGFNLHTRGSRTGDALLVYRFQWPLLCDLANLWLLAIPGLGQRPKGLADTGQVFSTSRRWHAHTLAQYQLDA